MKARTQRKSFSVEPLEDRNLMSAVAYGDFNNDGRADMAVVTNSTTITVSLANANGTYSVSAILTAPKNLPVAEVYIQDVNADGKLDITSGGTTSNQFYSHTWLGNGDGTFGARDTQKFSHFSRWWI